MIRYTTWGSIRGDCGHMHMSQDAAQSCIDQDRRGCQSQGGYSDRSVRVISGGNLPDIRRQLSGYSSAYGPGERIAEN